MNKSFNILVDNQSWEAGIPSFDLLSEEVHVWRTSLDLTIETRAALFDSLSEEEKNRADRMHFEIDRNRFIVSHGVLRCLLGAYLELDSKKFRFGNTPNEKPFIVTEYGRTGLTFNMSHSGVFGLYAMGQNREVGIDIEQIRHDVQLEQIANRFFSKGEIRSLRSFPEAKRLERFFQYWTRKEAFVKSTGDGVSYPLEECDVSSFKSGELSPIFLEGVSPDELKMHGRDLKPSTGYVAAIVAEGKRWRVSCRDFSINLLKI
jgi:4'-phosphopantetheinyl transferase